MLERPFRSRTAVNIAIALAKVRQLLAYRISIAELIGLAFLVGFPYLLVGVLWSVNHTRHLHEMHGADMTFSFLGAILFWPALMISDVCMV
jgi:hypothetical protein